MPQQSTKLICFHMEAFVAQHFCLLRFGLFALVLFLQLGMRSRLEWQLWFEPGYGFPVVLIFGSDPWWFLPYHGVFSAASWRDSVMLAVLVLHCLPSLVVEVVRPRGVVC